MRSSLMSEANDRDFAPPPASPGGQSDPDEYVFRFRVETPTDEAAYDDPLVELIRGQLADLLDAVVLTHRGRRVAIDGFRLLQEPEKEYRIFPPVDGEAQPEERGD
jgi:hypothetical protein